jgi:hypothetical protein
VKDTNADLADVWCWLWASYPGLNDETIRAFGVAMTWAYTLGGTAALRELSEQVARLDCRSAGT